MITWYFLLIKLNGAFFQYIFPPLFISKIAHYAVMMRNIQKFSQNVMVGNNVTIFYIREEKSCKIDTFVQLYVDRSQL